MSDPATTAEPVAPPIPVIPAHLDTPALVIDLDVVERNAARLSGQLAARDVALRPHAKTHKSLEIGRIQLEHGARGLTVGTIGEAEVFAAGGFDDLFIAYPIWADGPKARRLGSLHDTSRLRLRVGFDSAEGAACLARAVAGARRRLEVLLELDPGNHRSGAAPERAGDLAVAARELGLELVGLFTHGGHSYRGGDAIAGAATDEVATLTIGAAALRAVGIEPQVLSAGSTPTAIGAAIAPVSEIRAGTYILGDRQQATLGAVPWDGLAAVVATTVVSEAVDGQVVIDAGAKSLTKDVAPYLAGHGLLPAYPDAVIERVSDYHGVVRLAPGSPRPRLGEVVAVIPNHVCPVVDLFDTFVATRAGEAVRRRPVEARGRSR